MKPSISSIERAVDEKYYKLNGEELAAVVNTRFWDLTTSKKTAQDRAKLKEDLDYILKRYARKLSFVERDKYRVKRYRTDAAFLLASDAYWDGKNWERQGRNIFLFKTMKGNYFAQYQTKRRGEQDFLKPLSVEEAIELFEQLSKKEVEFSVAFPDVTIEDA